MDVTLIDYKSWEAEQGTTIDLSNSSLDGIAAHTSSAYRKASEMLNARGHLEDLVSKQELTDLERLQEYMVCKQQCCLVLYLSRLSNSSWTN